MKIIFELEFPVKKKEYNAPFIPAVGDYVNVRGLVAGKEVFKVSKREWDLDRNIITIFLKLL